MDQLLSSLVFGVFVALDVAILIAAGTKREGHPANVFGARFDHLFAVVRNSGG